MKDTKIAWCHHTFNPWWGCVKVSPGCTHCYAEAFAKRTGHPVWGAGALRRFFGDKHWAEPLKWDAAAKKAGERRRVFCASMADVFEDRDDLVEPRARLAYLIGRTPNLDWLLLTKRPENIARLWISDVVPPNVWLGTTIECKATRDRWTHLKAVPAAVRFLSIEPLLEDLEADAILGVEWSDFAGEYLPEQIHVLGGHVAPDWIIVGGESGTGARLCDVAWIRKLVAQARGGKVPCFVKQVGSKPWDQGASETATHFDEKECWPSAVCNRTSIYDNRIRLADAKGGDPAEWPADLRVREFPGGAS